MGVKVILLWSGKGPWGQLEAERSWITWKWLVSLYPRQGKAVNYSLDPKPENMHLPPTWLSCRLEVEFVLFFQPDVLLYSQLVMVSPSTHSRDLEIFVTLFLPLSFFSPTSSRSLDLVHPVPEFFLTFILSFISPYSTVQIPVTSPTRCFSSCPVLCFSILHSIFYCGAGSFSKNKCALTSFDSVTYRRKSKLNFGRPETCPIWVQPTSSSPTSCSCPVSPSGHSLHIHIRTFPSTSTPAPRASAQGTLRGTYTTPSLCMENPFSSTSSSTLLWLYDPAHKSGTWWNHSHSMASWVDCV